jgi:hypothetical protein
MTTDSTSATGAASPLGSVSSEGLGPEQIEALAVEHEAFGFGRVDAKGYTIHGFEPEGLAAFAAALMAAERERCAKPLEDAAARLLAPRRTNDFDRHVAGILQEYAARIRAA